MFAKSLTSFNVTLVLAAVWTAHPGLGRAVSPTPAPEMKRDWQSYGESWASWGESVGSSWESRGSVIGYSYASEGYSIGLSDASTWLASHSLQGTVTSVGSQLATVVTSVGGPAVTLANGPSGTVVTMNGAPLTVLAAGRASNGASSVVNIAISPLCAMLVSLFGGAAMGAMLL